ncbi:MAG: cysteine hydrolase [Actinobacteria bacterium]|nr:cysteine hydrolase [Actinomycetota bacterium]
MNMKKVPYYLEKEKTALLVVDMQNDFTREGGALELSDMRDKIPSVNKLINASRELNIPIIFIKFISGPKKTLVWNWTPSINPPTKCCWKNHKRFYPDIKKEEEVTEIIDEITVLNEDYIVEKYAYDAFYNTELEDVLRSLAVEFIIVCGGAIPVCINDTVTGAFERQFKLVVAEDAVASFDEDFKKFSMKLFDMKYGRVSSVEEIIDELKSKK